MLWPTWDDHGMRGTAIRGKQWLAGHPPSVPVVSLAGVLLIAFAASGVGTAQTAPSRRTVWDGAYTEAQAARGATAFGLSCSGCHALAVEGKAPLVGDSFWKSFSQKTVGELLDYISANMPNGAPGSLSKPVYADIAALMLKSNGFPPGNAELAPATMADVRIIPKDGNTELPANALARVVGCLARSGADWVVTNATTPERAERVRPGAEDATRTLGNRTMPLKFVLTKLDTLAGSRVAVSGLLIGVGGADGINVTEVNRLAPTCP
jgi:mono/diheme cytochrome c family protein